jgi:hypothetical protein
MYWGETKNVQFHGYGTFYLINGDKFMGFYHQNQVLGHGTYYRDKDS